jgi:hypothetical protein
MKEMKRSLVSALKEAYIKHMIHPTSRLLEVRFIDP